MRWYYLEVKARFRREKDRDEAMVLIKALVTSAGMNTITEEMEA